LYQSIGELQPKSDPSTIKVIQTRQGEFKRLNFKFSQAAEPFGSSAVKGSPPDLIRAQSIRTNLLGDYRIVFMKNL